MITDRQWNIFQQHVKPNATVRYGYLEGYLLETFPYAQDNERIDLERGLAIFYGHKLNQEGKFIIPSLELRVQLCERPEDEMIAPNDLEFWLHGDFLDFEQVIALGEVS